MTSKLTIEQAKRLRNDFECWQQDYDPKDDKEQYDMFGRGMAAMDMLIAGMHQEPVAYMVRRHDEHEGTGTLIHAEYLQRYQDRGDYHYTPLYRHAQPAPVVPDERAAFNAWNNEDNLPIAGVGAKNAAWLAWQARALLCGNSVLDVPPERPADSSDGDDVGAWFDEGWNACRAAMLQAGNSPVIGIDRASGPDRTAEVRYVAPPGYVMVPKEPTDEMIAAAMNCDDVLFNSDESFCVQFGNIYEAMLAAALQEVPDGQR